MQVSCGRGIANVNLMSSLIAIGVKSAYSLNLHRLGSAKIGARPSSSAKREHWDAYIARLTALELGKRVFWNLVVQVSEFVHWCTQCRLLTAVQRIGIPFPSRVNYNFSYFVHIGGKY